MDTAWVHRAFDDYSIRMAYHFGLGRFIARARLLAVLRKDRSEVKR